MSTANCYDIVGDVHGCTSVLRDLASLMGYDGGYRHPDGRVLVFVGDIADRGPDSIGALRLIMELAERGLAWSVLGNHDEGLLRYLTGQAVEMENSLRPTIESIEGQSDSSELKARLVRFLGSLPLLLRLDADRLTVAHAGVEEPMLRRPIDEQSRHFILNGDAIGKSPDGKTLRRDWAAEYTGEAFIVYGHTPQDEPVVRANSANIDTGACRKRSLTAFR